ncbi:uncharacterized protein LOC134652696 [Cydia amplana]|uniref:uncharacterized protein LOC134652696 n=1 Tax=Cydia amplana TaxID=1869771 RepID=UPI002FE5B9B7
MKWPCVLVLCFACATENAQREMEAQDPKVLEPVVIDQVLEPGTEGLEFLESTEIISAERNHSDGGPDPPDPHYPVQHAGPARNLIAVPLPLKESDHELMFNVSWLPPLGSPAFDYSLEVHSETDTEDCRMTMCYEYNIPGDATWWTIPAHASPVPETCAVRPGCAYKIRLLAHPWDGRTEATLRTELHECVSGVCSCAHAPRLPAPVVRAETVLDMGDMFVNISWSLPPPAYPQRLPKGLKKQFYFVSIGEQMVSDAHPSPWFAHKIIRHVPAFGPIADGDGPRYYLLPTAERREDKRLKDVKLLARVSVVDDRTCIGPAGNATAYGKRKEFPIESPGTLQSRDELRYYLLPMTKRRQEAEGRETAG